MSTSTDRGRRPSLLVVVCGTATEVGKTWMTATVCEQLHHAGVTVAARKPVQSFSAPDAANAATDAHILARATSVAAADVCPAHRWYPVPMAPPMAAAELGLPSPRLAELVDELRWPDPPVSIGFVETAGGVRSPLAEDGDAISLRDAISPDLAVLVADADLGTINSVRLSVAALAGSPIVVALNRFDPEAEPLHERNRRWLAEHDGFDVVTSAGALAGWLRDRVAEKDGAR